MSNCLNETTGLSTATSLSFLYGISYDDYDKSVSKKWLDEAVSIVEDYKANSKYWQVGLCREIVMQIYYSTSSGVSEEVQRGTLQTITKLGVSILLVFIMITLSLHENSYATSILIGTFSVSA